MKVHIFHSFFASTLGLRPVLASQFYKNMMKNPKIFNNCMVGWSDLLLFEIFEIGHIAAANQEYF